MRDNDLAYMGIILCVFALMAVGVGLGISYGSEKAKEELEAQALKFHVEAVQLGYGRWDVNEVGKTKFEWNKKQ